MTEKGHCRVVEVKNEKKRTKKTAAPGLERLVDAVMKDDWEKTKLAGEAEKTCRVRA